MSHTIYYLNVTDSFYMIACHKYSACVPRMKKRKDTKQDTKKSKRIKTSKDGIEVLKTKNHVICPYLHTINRKVLDFDLEKVRFQ